MYWSKKSLRRWKGSDIKEIIIEFFLITITPLICRCLFNNGAWINKERRFISRYKMLCLEANNGNSDSDFYFNVQKSTVFPRLRTLFLFLFQASCCEVFAKPCQQPNFSWLKIEDLFLKHKTRKSNHEKVSLLTTPIITKGLRWRNTN